MKLYATILILALGPWCLPARAETAPVCPPLDVEVFKAFLKSIDDGKGPNPAALGGRSVSGVQHSLGIPHDLQRKDTRMLCLQCERNYGANAWDVIQVDHTGHGSNYCARTSAKMINHYYGGTITADRLTYWMLVEYPDSNKKDWPIEYQQWHHYNSGCEMDPWACGFSYNDWSKFSSGDVKPTIVQIRSWIDGGHPVQVIIPGHSLVIDGYEEGTNNIHLLDPWSYWDGNDSHDGTGWRSYYGAYLNINFYYVWPTRAQVPSPRNDEASVSADSDGDGIVDFDEINRFHTSAYSSDSDGDGVPDKKEIISYCFDAAGNNCINHRIGDVWTCKVKVTHDPCGYVYNPRATGVPFASLPAGWTCPNCGNAKSGFTQNIDPDTQTMRDLVAANPDPDNDGLRAERDPNSDNDGATDGQEDTNRNGIFEASLGETDPFDFRDFHSPNIIRSDRDLMAKRYAVVGHDLLIHGNLYCSGNKALVKTESFGPRLVNVEESAESYHFDRGQAALQGGWVTINLDPVFLQTVTIDERNPPLIRLMPTADCRGLCVGRRTATSFTVKEVGGGTSNATFNWEVAAKRAGYAAERLGKLEPDE